MENIYHILIIAEILIAIGLGVLIVFQKTSGDGLITSSNKSNFMSVDSVAGALTTITSIFLLCFFINSMAIATIGSKISRSINITHVQNKVEQSKIPH
jgi:protein translocase SecG subunit